MEYRALEIENQPCGGCKIATLLILKIRICIKMIKGLDYMDFLYYLLYERVESGSFLFQQLQ